MARWTQNDLRKAMEEVRDGAFLQGTAKKYGIPRRTLRNHMNSGSEVKRIGRPAVLSAEEENELCERILRLSRIGILLTPKIVKSSVYKFCGENKIRNPFNSERERAGRKWFSLFRRRHPNLSIRKARTLNPGRAVKLNRVVNDYFDKLRKVFLDLDVGSKPFNIYNMDEKGCHLILHKAQSVLAEKGAKQVAWVGNEHGENVTIVACGNAAGQFIPPVILLKGKRKNEALETNLPHRSKVFMNQKGSMTTEFFSMNSGIRVPQFLSSMELPLIWITQLQTSLINSELHYSVCQATAHTISNLSTDVYFVLSKVTGTTPLQIIWYPPMNE